MSFSSVAFIVFMLAVFVVYYQIPHKFRYILLVFANTLFYGSFSSLYLFILLYMCFATYFTGLQMERRITKSGVFACIAAVTLPLFMYKYLNFLLDTLNRILSVISMPVSLSAIKLLYPIGISFYTFESLSYLIDIYKKRIPAEKNFFKLFIYISFFPNIISGPIERAGDFLPQLDKEKEFDYDRSVTGFRLMLLGLFKKVVCADYLAVLSDSVFDRVILFEGPVFIVAIIVYTYQIYLDFSGYTDIARGVAYALGFDLRENFRAPYLSKSIKEFFGRWHMSLSAWLKDYIYIPLGGSRHGKEKKYRNLLVTFLVSGLWHGASFTFIFWGMLHGIYQCAADAIEEFRKNKLNAKIGFEYNNKVNNLENVLKNNNGIKSLEKTDLNESGKAGKGRNFAGICVTFCLVAFAWLFFRANSLSEAAYVLRHMFTFKNFAGQLKQMGFLTPLTYVATALILTFTILLDILTERTDILERFAHLKLPARWICYIVMLTLIITMRSHIGADASFIYFSF